MFEEHHRVLCLLGDDLSVLPNIDRCAVHPSRLPGLPRRRPHRPGYTFGESLFFWRRFFLHDPLSTNLGRSPELSYTRHRFSSACHSCPGSAGHADSSHLSRRGPKLFLPVRRASVERIVEEGRTNSTQTIAQRRRAKFGVFLKECEHVRNVVLLLARPTLRFLRRC